MGMRSFPGTPISRLASPVFADNQVERGKSESQRRKRANREIGVPGAGAGSKNRSQTIFNFDSQVKMSFKTAQLVVAGE
jgi:hypothetical protein